MLATLPKIGSALVKLSFVAKTPKMKVEVHHRTLVKDWKGFEKNLKTKGFQKAALEHKASDSKLKRYVKNYGGYLSSKEVVGVVPSRTEKRNHKIKKLKSGRLGCSCKDWQYHHSVRSSDCAHIQELKQGLNKESQHPLALLGQGIAMSRAVNKAQKELVHGNVAEENQKRLYTGQPLIPAPRFSRL